MLDNKVCLLTAVSAPLLGALILPALSRVSARLRNFSALLLAGAAFICSLYLIPQVCAGEKIVFFRQLPLGFNLSFCADGLAVFMACVSSLVSSIVVFYSFGYIRRYAHQGEYYLCVLLFLGAMMGLIFSANLILFYFFWELTALSSWRLIGFFRRKPYVVRADKAFLITACGALLMLACFFMIHERCGSFELSAVKEFFRGRPLPAAASLLILAGILSKSALLPFQSWLPDAGVAPSPVTALLHAAVLVKIGVYAFARLFLATAALPQQIDSGLLWLCALSSLVSAAAAMVETDLKRIIAYSTISQIGFIFLALGLNSGAGLTAALLYILMHGLAKAGLFLCAGIVEQNTHCKDITKLGGLLRLMPLTAAAFLFCAFSVMGVPPLGGFFSKLLVFGAVAESGELWLGAAFLAAAVLTILYLLRLFNCVFLGEMRTPAQREGSLSMVASVVLLSVLALFAGIFIRWPYNFARLAAGHV